MRNHQGGARAGSATCADRSLHRQALSSAAWLPLMAQLLAAGVVAAPALAAAQSASPPAQGASQEPATVQAVVVTGRRIATRDYKSDSPISTINYSLIQDAGQPTLEKGIGEMPQFSAAQGTNEVGDVQGATGFAGGQSYSDLRGLGPNRALVLIDGRRAVSSNPNGSIDLNTIPTSMVQNVEVITGGASAAYGSDAIAGVVNFKMRNDFTGLEMTVQHGGATAGDGDSNLFSILTGAKFDDGRGHVVFDLEYADRQAVQGANRPFFANIRNLARPPEGFIPAGLFGTAPTIAAVNSVLAGYPGTTPISGSGLYNGAIGVNTDGTIFTDLAGANCVQNYKGAGTQKGLAVSPNCRQVQVALGQYFALQVPLTKYNAYAHGEYKLTNDITAYSQFSFMESTSRDETAGGSTGPGKYLYIPMNNPFLQGNTALQTILASRSPSPSNPNALTQPLAMTKLLSMSGDRIQLFKYDVFQVLGGVKGAIPGTPLTFDAYGWYGRSEFTNTQNNDTSKAAIQSLLDGTSTAPGCSGYAWNPFGNNPLSAACRNYVVRQNHNLNTIDQKNFEASVSGPIWKLPAGDLSFALGGDYRETSFDYQPDHGLVLADTPSYDTAVPTSGRQRVSEAFAELLVPVVKNLPFAKEVTLDLGYRYSDYNLFGGVSTWKADASWTPIDTIRFRGGFQRAIRAPSVGELFAPTVTGNLNIGAPPNAGDPCAVGSSFRSGANAGNVQKLCLAQGVPSALYPTYTYGIDSVHGISGGNPNLTPEKADTYSIGAVWTPQFSHPLLKTFRVSVDYYNIQVTNAVGSLSLTDILPRCFNADGVSNPSYSTGNVYCNQITRDPNTGNIVLGREGLLNLATYQTDGIDTQIDWQARLSAFGLSDAAGTVTLNSVISYLNSFQVASLPGSPVLDFAGSIGNASVSPEIAHPHWKTYTTLAWTDGPFSAAVHWRLIDAMKHQDRVVDPTATTPGVPVYSYFDIDGSWKFRRGWELNAGITNLFDKAPPFVSGTPLTTDSATYDIIGRSYHVALKAKF